MLLHAKHGQSNGERVDFVFFRNLGGVFISNQTVKNQLTW